MYYYFSASHPAVIKINGKLLGDIFNQTKYVEICDCPFIEVCPISCNAVNANFIIDGEFLSNPPDNILVTDMMGGYLIKILKPIKQNPFNVVFQTKLPNALVTAFTETGQKLSVETKNDFYAESVDFEFNGGSAIQQNDYVIITLKGEKTLVSIYNCQSKIEKTISFVCDEFDAETLTATTYHKDMAKHIVKEKLIVDNGNPRKTTVSIENVKQLSPYSMPQDLVPYAMLEELLIGGNIKEYLTGGVLENSQKLSAFFGDFIGVMPPPFFRKDTEIGLIYKTAKNTYKVDYFTFEYRDKKIINIIKTD